MESTVNMFKPQWDMFQWPDI